MTGEKLKEFMRRLTAAGCEPDLDERGAGAVRDGERSVHVMDDGEIRYKPENRELAHRVHAIYNEVDEYMTAFERAAPEKLPDRGKGFRETRTLLTFGNTEFAMRLSARYGADFVTWGLDRNGEREIGHYSTDYVAAKEDFAMRCGLIDRRKLFNETELRLIRSSLAEIGDITPDRGVTEMTAIRSLADRINDILIPALADEEQSAEDQGAEPEIDL